MKKFSKFLSKQNQYLYKLIEDYKNFIQRKFLKILINLHPNQKSQKIQHLKRLLEFCDYIDKFKISLISLSLQKVPFQTTRPVKGSNIIPSIEKKDFFRKKENKRKKDQNIKG